MIAQREENVWALYGQEKIGGAIDGALTSVNGIPLLVYAVGTDAVTGTTAPYTHTVSASNGDLTSITVEKNLGNFQSEQYAGCKVNKYTLKLPATNTEASFTADVMGQSVAILNSPTAVTIDHDPPFVFAEGALTLFGQSLTQTTNVEITIENNLKEVFTVGSVHTLQYLVPTTRKITGKLTLVFTSLNDVTWGYFNKAMPSLGTPTQGALLVTLQHPVSLNEVQINLPQINIAKLTDQVKVGDVIMQDLEFTASYSFSSGYDMQAIIMNPQSAAF